MDVESDGSERWEDFFGSSTDIGPSVLGYLDTLANNFSEEAKQLVESSNNKQQPPPAPEAVAFPLQSNAHVIKHNPSGGVLLNGGEQSRPTVREAANIETPQRTNVFRSAVVVPSSSADLSSGRVKKFSDKFLNLVSPNVQRMVSNTVESNNGNVGNDEPPAIPFARNHIQCASFNAPSRKPSRQPAAATVVPSQVTHHKQQLPLSKNIAKLTHINGELIDIFIDNIASARQRLPREPPVLREGSAVEESTLRAKEPIVMDGNGNVTVDKHCPMEELQNVSALQLKIQSLTVDLEKGDSSIASVNGSTDGDSPALTPTTDRTEGSGVVLRNETNGSINMEDAFVENCADAMAEQHRNTVVEAFNYYPNLGRDVSGGTDDRLATLADARAKLLDSNKNCKVSVPHSPKLASRVPIEHCTSASTPSLDTTTSGSPYSSKASLLIPPNTPVLSSRPLSASSICSYSSSASSSGSEHHLPGGKGSAPGSYQASVESLADHSESERHCEGTGDHGPVITVGAGMTMCERAVREIIDSESSYVKDLGQVIRGYLEDWKERACLKHDQLKVLFSNIQEIYDFNFKLLNRLREAKGDPVTISHCFIDLHAEFSCYTTYCTSYPEAISLLTTLLQATHTNALLVSTQKMLKHTLPLGSYLLKPVQRILKYHLLLDNLRKHYNDQQVALAHELMKKVAHNIDQVKTKLDQAQLVKQLAGILDGWLGPDLSVLGDLLHEGRLMEHSKPRIVLLFQTMLIIAKPKEDKRLQFRAYIPCKNLMLVEHLPGEPISFRVIPFDDPKGALQLTARNREEKRLWTQQIKQAMLQHYSDIPTRAKELVLQLGDEDERFTDKQYWKRPTNNSPIPEYLERRQQFRRSEMRMKSKKNLLKKEPPTAAAPPSFNGLSTPSFRSYSNDLEGLSAIDQPPVQPHHESSTEDCKCDAVKRQLQEEIKARPGGTQHSPPPKPARSRSETRCGPADDEEERLLKSLYERRKLSVPTRRGAKVKESFASIRSYNSTMIPKRISEIRKRRPKTVTSSSTFYTDLEISSEGTEVPDQEPPVEVPATSNDDEPRIVPTSSDTAFHATEDRARSTAPTHFRMSSIDSECGEEQKKDSEIISQLILDVEQFNKVLNKPVTKKKSFDASSCTRPIGLLSTERKPELPNTEPPCDEDIETTMNDEIGTSQSAGLDEAEPIYESLLRNVHVPYKYAPSCLARHSLPCGEVTTSSNGIGAGPKVTTPASQLGRRTRPESDYVTLAYSELGLLKGVACEDTIKAPSPHKTPQLLRMSDTNISYHRESTGQAKESDEEEKRTHAFGSPTSSSLGPEASCTLKQSFLERQGSLSMKTTAHKSFLQRFISLHSSTSSTSMTSSSTLGSEGNLLLHSLQRKISEPSGGSFGHIYKQGSIDLGSRIAHLDYADPKTLFAGSSTVASASSSSSTTVSGTNQNVLINRASMQQRDSVLASSSSSDSVCEESVPNSTTLTVYDDDEQCCFYERTVEECLEHDFRDSAVYSGDDNDRQRGGPTAASDQHLYEALTPVTSPSAKDQQITRNSGPPPPIPAKPAHLGQQCKRQPMVVATGTNPTVVTNTTTTTATNSRGWVLQQVRRFQ